LVSKAGVGSRVWPSIFDLRVSWRLNVALFISGETLGGRSPSKGTEPLETLYMVSTGYEPTLTYICLTPLMGCCCIQVS
jgi:hypothetical protein